MKLIEHIDNIEKPFERAVVTIGNFDGVHIGHQALFHTVIEKAEELNGTSVAMTFEPHPMRVLKKKSPPLLTIYEQKVELIAKTRIDALVCIEFTKKFGNISASSFLRDILIRTIGMRAIVVGKDSSFGKNREGDLDFLKKNAEALGYEVIAPEWIQFNRHLDQRVSSTSIRETILEGRVDRARYLLGRFYQIRGEVVRGRNRGGRLLGFPTANILLQDELCPKTGVYAVTAEVDGRIHKAVANIGYSPTFGDGMHTVEVHLLNFKGYLYDQKIRVDFIRRIRDEMRFNGIEDLANQIKADIRVAEEILEKAV